MARMPPKVRGVLHGQVHEGEGPLAAPVRMHRMCNPRTLARYQGDYAHAHWPPRDVPLDAFRSIRNGATTATQAAKWGPGNTPPPRSASTIMVCAKCGERAHDFRWHSEHRPEGPREEWWGWRRDVEDYHLYWYLVCIPACRANRIWVVLDRVDDTLSRLVPAVPYAVLHHLMCSLREALEDAYQELQTSWRVLQS